MHFEISISLFGKISSAGKGIEPDWTPILLRFFFQNQRFYKIQRTGLGIIRLWTFHKYFSKVSELNLLKVPFTNMGHLLCF
jgi:hypothetical protein